MIHSLKLMALSLGSLLPGPMGEAAETRRLRRWKAQRAPAALERFRQCREKLDASSICLDLGANVGEYTEILAQTAGRVHAFEPDPWAFAQLSERVGHMENVTLHNAAIADRAGSVVMRRHADFDADPATASVGTSILELAEDLPTGETFEVPCIDIRAFLRDLDGQVALMKVDIEGAELDLLEALLDAPELAKVDAIFVETHEVNIAALRDRTLALRRRLKQFKSPYINLDWP